MAATAVETVLARIAAHRGAREELIAAVERGERPVADLVAADPLDVVAATTRVLVLVEAAPGARKVASRRLLDRLGIDPLAELAEIGADRRAGLAAALRAGDHGPEA